MQILFGGLQLLSSAFFSADWSAKLKKCGETNTIGRNKACKPELYYVIGAGMGSIAAFWQIVLGVVGLLGKIKAGMVWPMQQFAITVCLICAFSIPISEDALDIETTPKGSGNIRVYRARAQFFLLWSTLDALFSIATIPVVHRLLIRQKKLIFRNSQSANNNNVQTTLY